MKVVENPEVYLIASPMIEPLGMCRYLEEVNGMDWFERLYGNSAKAGLIPVNFTSGVPAAEGLIEFMGRLCYRSWVPGLNANVTKIREDRGDYLLNVLRSGHGSVLEHATFSFVIHNCSRVLTAELNRHRAGIAISEQSLRYVRLDDLPFRLPPVLTQESQDEMSDLVELIEKGIAKMIEREITDEMPFALKKEKTSAIRRIAPLGLGTEEGWTANVRAIRHVISVRSNPHAEEEIRVFADQLASIMQKQCPLLFGDFVEEPVVDGPAAWETPHAKV